MLATFDLTVFKTATIFKVDGGYNDIDLLRHFCQLLIEFYILLFENLLKINSLLEFFEKLLADLDMPTAQCLQLLLQTSNFVLEVIYKYLNYSMFTSLSLMQLVDGARDLSKLLLLACT